jgi:hypothetical protein
MGKLLQTLESLQLQDGLPDIEGRRTEYVITFLFVLPVHGQPETFNQHASCAKQR